MSHYFLFLMACMLPVQLDPKQDAMHQEAKRCIEATTKGDYKTLADLTYPGVIERIGGKERMIELIARGMDEMAEKGMKFKFGSVEAPSKLVQGEDGLYGVIPTSLVLETPDANLTLKGFLVGYSKDQGKTWVFIDGANGPDALRREFTQIPETLILPEKQKPKFELKSEVLETQGTPTPAKP